jgi:biotin carboxylase
MAHILVVDLPGGNDFDILDALLDAGHDYTFLTSDLDHYLGQPDIAVRLESASECLNVPLFNYEDVELAVLARHKEHHIDGLLCLVDIRLIEAAKLSQSIGARHISLETAQLIRDKARVRQRIAQHGLGQPIFRVAEDTESLKAAVDDIGLPVLIKPVDGYGSQNIIVLQNSDDLHPWLNPLDQLLPARHDYGFGVQGVNKLLVERYLTGELLGCDTFSVDGKHCLIGVHHKKMFPPPSFAIQGSTFTPKQPVHQALEDYVCEVLNSVAFDHGAAHIEIMMTDEVPKLVEINGRLVGAKIARLMNGALGESVHDALIRLHLGELDPQSWTPKATRIAVSRWIVADRAGKLKKLSLPEYSDDIFLTELLVKVGDSVSPPFENADRLGVVMSVADEAHIAEALADDYVDRVSLTITDDIATH